MPSSVLFVPTITDVLAIVFTKTRWKFTRKDEYQYLVQLIGLLWNFLVYDMMCFLVFLFISMHVIVLALQIECYRLQIK